jgi:hypothetical protein
MNHPCWHPDGYKIVFTDSDPEGSYMGGTYGGQIKEVTYPGGVVTTLWTPELQTPVQREEGFAPLYSPDGTKIAFHVNLSAGGGGDYSRQGLWVMDADGSNAQLVDGWVTVNDSECGWLYSTTQHEWSHDSEWIAYIDRGFGGGPATSGTFSVWKIRPDGTDKTMLADGDAGGGNFNLHYMGWGAWLPDDSAVIASEHLNSGSGISVVALSADGSGGTTLVDGASGDGPYFGQNFHGAYRLGDRIYWINQLNNFDYPYTGVLIKSCALDGSDLQTYYDGSALDNAVSPGSGFEWI